MAKPTISYILKVNILPRLCTRSLSVECRTNTAGIVVIGDEILKGEVADTNSSYMTSRLHGLGVKVKKISVIGDILQEICDEVRLFSKLYTYVITTGGIGPTHDDVTFEGVAKAFNEPLIMHPELVEICKQFYKTSDLNAPGMKLARVPQSARLTFLENPKLNYPNVAVGNVYMFPGIPQLFQRSFDLLGSVLFQSGSKFYTKYLYFNVSEDKLARALDYLVKEFPNVLVGSYPEVSQSVYKVKITIESTEEKLTAEAYKKLLEIVPRDSVVRY